ncbi:MAG: bifunctional 5,10-methylenetetrahydrofolate dehydrogenase/5,10-methenyltetrahydrofolate cyclohydrolase [Parcubacteria group bacterium]|nr:bifunctional 5,10-methylenetetrahydrofolate dehydrogenase/5,10-methenyltetrahydrofolate cyclohydrolase [Parcubacteria group bacterium]
MVVDGKKFAEDLRGELLEERKRISGELKLAAVLVGDAESSLHFLKQKEKIANEIGVGFELIQFPADTSTEKLKTGLAKISQDPKNTGVIVQLPLPGHIEPSKILDSLPKEKDVDVLSFESFSAFLDGRSKILPPVVGAMDFILEKNGIDSRGKLVAVVGTGRLVGLPAMIWFSRQGGITCLFDRATGENARFLREADIIIAGSGNPNSITAEMVKPGAVVLDAGYEVVAGKPTGDVDFENVSKKASLITPVPGGIGPLTVVMLFKNLLKLAGLQM